MSTPIIVLIAFVVIVILYIILTYNSFHILKVRIKEAFSGIDVQLKRRVDLIPNLVETVKGYAKHEKTVFENVTKARTALMGAKGMSEKAEANNMLTGALKSLFAVAEAYPELKASEGFVKLQKQLEDTEDKIAYSRQFYNSNVMVFNTKIRLFPHSIIAGMFGFKKPEEFFKAKAEEKEEVKVKF